MFLTKRKTTLDSPESAYLAGRSAANLKDWRDGSPAECPYAVRDGLRSNWLLGYYDSIVDERTGGQSYHASTVDPLHSPTPATEVTQAMTAGVLSRKRLPMAKKKPVASPSPMLRTAEHAEIGRLIEELEPWLIGVWRFRREGWPRQWAVTWAYQGQYYDVQPQRTKLLALKKAKASIEKMQTRLGPCPFAGKSED